MKEKILSCINRYKLLISVIAITAIAFLCVWGLRLRDAYMPIQHKSSIVDGCFSVSQGEIRRIDAHTADGNELKTDSIKLSVRDSSGSEVWSNTYNKKIEFSDEAITLDEFELGRGIVLTPGKYYISAEDTDGNGINIVFDLYEYRGRSSKLLILIFVAVLLLEAAVIFVLCNKKNLPLQYSFAILAVLLGLFINIVFPPLGVPDEKLHFKQSYEIASNILHPFDKTKVYENDRLLIRATDYDSIYYLHSAASIAGWYEGLWDKADKTPVPIDTGVTVTSSGKYAYFFGAVGIVLARVLGMNGHWLLLLGRLFNMAACVTIICFAIKTTPMKKSLFMLIALLPESLQLISSYSYDGINLALVMMFIAYIFSLYEQQENIRSSQLVGLLALLFIMLPIKVAYVPMCALVLLLPFKNFSNKKVIYVFAGISVILTVLLAVFGKVIVGKMIPLDNFSLYMTDPESKVSVGYAFHNIRDIMSKYFSTIWFFTNRYFAQMFGSIYGVTKAEGLDIYTMPIVMHWMLAVLFGISAVSENKQKNGLIKKTIVWMIGFLCAMLALAGMLFAATNIGSWKILGFQGRYYLPALCLAPLAFDITCIKIDEDLQNKICLAGMSAINILFWTLAFIYYLLNYFGKWV